MILERVSNNLIGIPKIFLILMIFPNFWLPKIIKKIVESGLENFPTSRLDFT